MYVKGELDVMKEARGHVTHARHHVGSPICLGVNRPDDLAQIRHHVARRLPDPLQLQPAVSSRSCIREQRDATETSPDLVMQVTRNPQAESIRDHGLSESRLMDEPDQQT